MTAVAAVPAAAFGAAELPYGVFSVRGSGDARVGVAIGDHVLDVHAVLRDDVFAQPSLNAFMARGREFWTATRARLRQAIEAGVAESSYPAADVELRLPFDVADFVDFNSSLQHATNAGRIFRPGAEPVRANWLQMPVGYHARTGTIVVSGAGIPRPRGQYLVDGRPVFAPTHALDVEAEVGFVVGTPSQPGIPLRVSDFDEHVFGVVLVLDWSARDIQGFETVPLGPFLGKSFATSMSSWVLPLEALADARVAGPRQEPPPPEHLRPNGPGGFDVRLELSLNETVVARPSFGAMYWTPAQQLAHLTSNGARVRTGDLFASGTVSDEHEFGSLLELTWDGQRPIRLADGSSRGYLDDGDRVRLSACAHDSAGNSVSLGEVSGTVGPAMAAERAGAAH